MRGTGAETSYDGRDMSEIADVVWLTGRGVRGQRVGVMVW